MQTNITSAENKISFLFEQGKRKGENYIGTYEICPNPACNCGTITFNVARGRENIISKPIEVSFAIDVLRKKVYEEPTEKADYFDIGFAKEFVNELKRDDWDKLHSVYLKFKEESTKTFPIELIDTNFPYEDIEKDGALVGFYQILPYAEKRFLEIELEKFFIDDDYCVYGGCDCSNVYIGFFPYLEDEIKTDDFTEICLDYIKKNWEIKNQAENIKASPEELMAVLLEQKWESWFAERHKS